MPAHRFTRIAANAPREARERSEWRPRRDGGAAARRPLRPEAHSNVNAPREARAKRVAAPEGERSERAKRVAGPEGRRACWEPRGRCASRCGTPGGVEAAAAGGAPE